MRERLANIVVNTAAGIAIGTGLWNGTNEITNPSDQISTETQHKVDDAMTYVHDYEKRFPDSNTMPVGPDNPVDVMQDALKEKSNSDRDIGFWFGLAAAGAGVVAVRSTRRMMRNSKELAEDLDEAHDGWTKEYDAADDAYRRMDTMADEYRQREDALLNTLLQDAQTLGIPDEVMQRAIVNTLAKNQPPVDEADQGEGLAETAEPVANTEAAEVQENNDSVVEQVVAAPDPEYQEQPALVQPAPQPGPLAEESEPAGSDRQRRTKPPRRR